MKRNWVKDASVSKCSKENTGRQGSSPPLSRIVPLKTYYFRIISGALTGEDIHKSHMQRFHKQPSCMIVSMPSSFFLSSFSTSYSFLLPAPWLMYKLYETGSVFHSLHRRNGIFISIYRAEDFHSFCTANPNTWPLLAAGILQEPESKTDLRCAYIRLVYVPRLADETEQALRLPFVKGSWDNVENTRFNTILHLAP